MKLKRIVLTIFASSLLSCALPRGGAFIVEATVEKAIGDEIAKQNTTIYKMVENLREEFRSTSDLLRKILESILDQEKRIDRELYALKKRVEEVVYSLAKLTKEEK